MFFLGSHLNNRGNRTDAKTFISLYVKYAILSQPKQNPKKFGFQAKQQNLI